MNTDLLGLEITDRCDLACGHCLRAIVPEHSPRARDLDFALIERLVGEARDLGIAYVGITGGEAMLHPRFLDILDVIVDAGRPYHFLTNGLGLPAFIPRWLQRPERREKLRAICVSLDGATAETHDAIRGRGTFHRTLAGIAVLRAMKIPFAVFHCVNRKNRHEIDQMGLLAHHLGAEKLFIAHFLPNGRPDATAEFDLNTAERHEVEFVIKRLIDAMRFPIYMGEGYYTDQVDHECPTVRGNILNVDPNGHLTFCCELSNFYGDRRPAEQRDDFIADLRQVSLREGLELQRARIERFRAERLADPTFGEDDRFACRYCVRHFGKPEHEVVQIRRRVTV